MTLKATGPENESLVIYLNHLLTNELPAKFLQIEPSDRAAAEAKDRVYEIYKQKQPSFAAASGELAPVFGLGDDSVAKQRAQGLFKHAAFLDAYAEFTEGYLRGRWDLPVGGWREVHRLFHRHRKGPSWSDADAVLDRAAWNVDHYYARFVIRCLDAILQEQEQNSASWLQEATVCDGCFVLLHALMYLQLETMRDYKKHAPAKDRIGHVAGAWKAKMANLGA
ncbi:hypothetical protein GGR52DRAFT_532664 [Hypoxylon sp. FL1284]|nr:hypothetical protein GGR52DRAFT_532664 [Hypoxylon sp. FL1284]